METKEQIDEMEMVIIDAIKAKNAKKLLQQKEHQIVVWQRRKFFIRTLSGIAAAACLLFGIIQFNEVITCKAHGEKCYAALILPEPRGGNVAADLILTAYEQIGAKEYDKAHKNIDAAILLLKNEKFDLNTEEGKYFHQLTQSMIEDAEWLKTIAFMKQGKWKKTKKRLQKIVAGNSIYKIDAQKILK